MLNDHILHDLTYADPKKDGPEVYFGPLGHEMEDFVY